MTALKNPHLNDMHAVEEILFSANSTVKLKAEAFKRLEKVENQRMLRIMLELEPNEELRVLAVNKCNDREVLKTVAENDLSSKVRNSAKNALSKFDGNLRQTLRR